MLYKQRKIISLTLLFLFLPLLVSANPLIAKAILHNKQGRRIGEIKFVQQPDKEDVEINLKIINLPPGEYALHIHQNADCDCPQFKCAGGHFNPYNTQHGFLNKKGPHAGDLPNFRVGKNRVASKSMVTNRITLENQEQNSLFAVSGTSVVIHKNPDDYYTNPAGRGGLRLACGVIKRH
jgi:Cu-Zn family superoxide dismutase